MLSTRLQTYLAQHSIIRPSLISLKFLTDKPLPPSSFPSHSHSPSSVLLSHSHNLTRRSYKTAAIMVSQTPTLRHKVAVIGSGNWGSTIAKIAAENTKAHPELFHPEVSMWVFDEMVMVPSESRHFDSNASYCNKPEPLSSLVNKLHENVKYLPDIALPHNLIANPSIQETVRDATILIFNLPHEFLRRACRDIKGHNLPFARAISCIKGVELDENNIKLLPDVIGESLGIHCGVLSGANIAAEVALEKYAETTVAYYPPSVDLPSKQDSGAEIKASNTNLVPVPADYPPVTDETMFALFDRPYFQVEVVADVAGVSLSGALKNVIALAVGFVDGLGLGDNAKSAVFRVGLNEMVRFGKLFCSESHQIRTSTFTLESCGVADLFTSCVGGRNFRSAKLAVQSGKTVEQVEKETLNGQKLQGISTAYEVNAFLRKRELEGDFPLFTAVHATLAGKIKPEDITSLIRVEKTNRSTAGGLGSI